MNNRNRAIVIREGESREVIIYRDANNAPKVEVLLQHENLWLTQKSLAQLFDVGVPAITKHIKNIYEVGELQMDATISKMEIVQQEGTRMVNRTVDFYNLELVIAVGYRVNSERAIMFRTWATNILKEYIKKGSVLDTERLKQPEYIFGQDYFDETLERIRDIRSSERRFYQKITDIYSQCSADYDVNSELTKTFFATVQNKLHWAISNETAAEIIYSRANHEEENMGLTSWKNSPNGRIRKSDVSAAKNYLSHEELESLNLIVSAYLDLAELRTKRRQVMYMSDWIVQLDKFLLADDRDILQNAGKISAAVAKEKAEGEFEKYQVIQDRLYQSDFDLFMQLESDIKE
ncbi:MAG: virulence RhuM family protein [Rikenellaceae bacterium]